MNLLVLPFLISISIFISTLAPTVIWGDSAKLAIFTISNGLFFKARSSFFTQYIRILFWIITLWKFCISSEFYVLFFSISLLRDLKKGYLIPIFGKNGVFIFKVRYER